MLKIDPSLNHVPAKREHVIALYESINQPLVNIPGHGTAPTGAFVLGTRNDSGYYSVFVYLFQPETRAVVIYVCEPRGLSSEQYRMEEGEGVRFVESMGFMIDNVHFPTLAPPEQETVMARVPLFRPPERTVDLYEVADERLRMPPAQAPQMGDPLDAIFGGLSQADGDVFLRAGLSPSGRPSPSSGRPTTPGMGQGPIYGGASSPPFGGNMSHPPRPALPLQGTPVQGALLHGQGPPTSGFGPPTYTGREPVEAKADPEVLDRIGRLLGAFGWALALATLAAGSACKTASSTTNVESSEGTEANVDLGNQQLAQGRFPEAIQTFTQVLSEEEGNKDALRGTGLAYMNLGRAAQAEPYYVRAVAADPKFSIAKNELAVVLMKLDRCAEAEPLLNEVIEDIFYTTPEFAEHNLAKAMACQGRTKDALTRLEKLVIRRPQFCLGYLTLAQLSAQAKEPEKTIGACDDFAANCEAHEEIKRQISPDQSGMCYLQKGMAYATLGDVESARTWFERCVTIGGQLGKQCKASLEMLTQ